MYEFFNYWHLLPGWYQIFVHIFAPSLWCPPLWPFPSCICFASCKFQTAFDSYSWPGFCPIDVNVVLSGCSGWALGQSLCCSHQDQDSKWPGVSRNRTRTCVGLCLSVVSFCMDSPTHCAPLLQLLQQLPGQPHFISLCEHLFLFWLSNPDFLLPFLRWMEMCKQPSPLTLSSVRHLIFLNCVFSSFLIGFDIYTFPPYNNVSIWQLHAVKTDNSFSMKLLWCITKIWNFLNSWVTQEHKPVWLESIHILQWFPNAVQWHPDFLLEWTLKTVEWSQWLGEVPGDWERADIPHIFRDDHKGGPGQYRTSITVVPGEVMKKILLESIPTHMRERRWFGVVTGYPQRGNYAWPDWEPSTAMWAETLWRTRPRGQVKDDTEHSPRTFSSKMGLLAQVVGIFFIRKTSKASHFAFLNFPLCLLWSGITCEKKYICQDIVSSCCRVVSSFWKKFTIGSEP